MTQRHDYQKCFMYKDNKEHIKEGMIFDTTGLLNQKNSTLIEYIVKYNILRK